MPVGIARETTRGLPVVFIAAPPSFAKSGHTLRIVRTRTPVGFLGRADYVRLACTRCGHVLNRPAYLVRLTARCVIQTRGGEGVARARDARALGANLDGATGFEANDARG